MSPERLNEGSRDSGPRPTLRVAYQLRKGVLMTAEQLKRKLRNFPVANLSARLASA
jgi:hypothetical protein